jgi:hypothetical protein
VSREACEDAEDESFTGTGAAVRDESIGMAMTPKWFSVQVF